MKQQSSKVGCERPNIILLVEETAGWSQKVIVPDSSHNAGQSTQLLHRMCQAGAVTNAVSAFFTRLSGQPAHTITTEAKY